MESYETPAEQLRNIERAQTAPWIDYPPTPNWYFPAAGAWLALMCLTVIKINDGVAWVGLLLVLVVLEGAFVGWSVKRRKAHPNLRTVPTEIKPLVKWFFGLALAIVALTIGLILSDLEVVGVVVGAGLTAFALYVYEKKFEAAASVARERLDLA